MTRESSWRTEPAAALRGLAKSGFPSFSSRAFSRAKSRACMIASPRTARRAGAFRRAVRSCSGTDRIVRTLAVTPSPRTPSPRVDARASRPRSYTSSSDRPSNLGSKV